MGTISQILMDKFKISVNPCNPWLGIFTNLLTHP